jgi:uncharacterized OB-fold protein
MAQTTETGQPETETMGLPAVGQEGDVCAQCGSVLATDQRYCLNCGSRRGEPRVDFEARMVNGVQPATAGAAPTQAPAGFQQSPIFAVGTIALLGIMLLLGVLIGKDDNGGGSQTVVAAPAQTTPTTTTPTASATPTPTPKNKKVTAAPGQGKVEKGGTGSTQGVQQVDTAALEQAANSGEGAQAGKNLPDQVATGGQQEAIDPKGIKNAGGNDGSPSACIGC